VEVCAYVRVPDLTIVGAGKGQTILGPTTYYGSTQTFSPICLVWENGNERFIEGITFRNCYDGLHIVEGPLYVDECEFLDNGGTGVTWGTNQSGGWIRNSFFESNILGNLGLFCIWGGGDILIENCEFVNSRIVIQNIQNIFFLNCEMRDGRVGIEFTAGASGTLNNCRIYGFSISGLGLLSSNARCDVIDTEISGGIYSAYVTSGGELNVQDSILTGGSDSVIRLRNPRSATVHNTHIFPTGPVAIRTSQHESLGLVEHDFTGNYWGTTDPDEVASWILDQTDDPSNYSIVNYLPIAGGPVPTEQSTFGSFKALFR
jgi:hypothetical protein